MKKLLSISILTVLTATLTLVGAQNYPDEYLGLPGDNLNLYAVMKLFQESETLEGFERNLNEENSRINNLDLNGDNMIDYLTVSDYVDGNVHTIVLRAVVGRDDYQDVAVFVVEKFRNGSVQIQLIGDEALYGKNYIVEPIYAETANPGYLGTPAYRSNVNVVYTTYYDIAAWPVIRFIYLPHYRVWRSAWYWGYYPVYWNPWRPYYWHYYYGYHYHWHPHYYAHYRHWNHHRGRHYDHFYYSRIRTYSPTVVININKGNYRHTYSRPDQRREGEALYARTQSRSTYMRSDNASARQTTRSSATQPARVNTTQSRVNSAAGRSPATVNRSVQSRSNTTGNTNTAYRTSSATGQGRQAVSTAGRSTQAVSRSSAGTAGRSSVPTVSGRTTNQSTVQSRSSASKASPAVRSSTTTSSSVNRSSAVQRSSSNPRSSASVSKSTPSRSTGSVQRSSGSRSSATVQKSSSHSSRPPAVQRSSGSSRSSAGVSRSSGSSSKGSSHVSRSSGSSRSSAGVSRSSGSRSSSSSPSRSSRR
ncbi:MAG: hypothetical protein JXR52_09650 [Bacteroidales bacterium]|nr:hypothetical protein [Bacteroidales bacterium]MBN2699081.1 hypothetical protein [Bacteroidales bacterium]